MPPLPDSVKTFTVDDYTVTNDMLGSHKDTINGQVYSPDELWFTNTTLAQTLIFELYTDYHRLAIFHFYNDEIPAALIHRKELNAGQGKPANTREKPELFRKHMREAIRIDARYFTSVKGFRLGDDKAKALAVYGRPDKTTQEEGSEVLQWNFTGNTFYDSKTNLEGKPVAKNSYGHEVTMFFNNNKLTAVILHNDIP